MAKYTKCLNPSCPNFGLWALHPRSKTPEICGVCGGEVVVLGCSECGSYNLFKKGYVYTKSRGTLQRYKCKNCACSFCMPMGGQN